MNAIPLQNILENIVANSPPVFLAQATSIVQEIQLTKDKLKLTGYSVKQGTDGFKILQYTDEIAATQLLHAENGNTITPLNMPEDIRMSDLSAPYLASYFRNLQTLKIKSPHVFLPSIREYSHFIESSGLYDLANECGLFRCLPNLEHVFFMVQYEFHGKQTIQPIDIQRSKITSRTDNLPLPQPYMCLQSQNIIEQALLADLCNKKSITVFDIDTGTTNNPSIFNQNASRTALLSAVKGSDGCSTLTQIGHYLQSLQAQQPTYSMPQPQTAFQQALQQIQPIPQPPPPPTPQQTPPIKQPTHEAYVQPQPNTPPSEYDENKHGLFKSQAEKLILDTWRELYGDYINGHELINGFIIPNGSIEINGKSVDFQGILPIDSSYSQHDVIPTTVSDIVYQEFKSTCKEFNIPMHADIGQPGEVGVLPYQYSPFLQRRIAKGDVDPNAIRSGWNTYCEALKKLIDRATTKIAIKKYNAGGSDDVVFKELSGYTMSLMAINFRNGLGTQIKFCCGDTSKLSAFAQRFAERLQENERKPSGARLYNGNARIVAAPISSDAPKAAVINIYLNEAGYQAVPNFMGERLCNMKVGTFRPDISNMLIGVKLDNTLKTTKDLDSWFTPIIAGQRSGKGVLTLNMLLNVLGTGTPLFYLDGKPDMANLLWDLQKEYNIPNSIVVDGMELEGITPIDKKTYQAPYYDNYQKAIRSSSSHDLLADNKGIMIYLKTMLVMLLCVRYYRDVMHSTYNGKSHNLFVVFDEVHAMIASLAASLYRDATDAQKGLKQDSSEYQEFADIKKWIDNIVNAYKDGDKGVFQKGITAFGLSQPATVNEYQVGMKDGPLVDFCKSFLLYRRTKLAGRQNKCGLNVITGTDANTANYNLYQKYMHFGQTNGDGTTFDSADTFKPLLVLNENDAREVTGAAEDGAFTATLMSNISKHMTTDEIQAFRAKYFSGAPDIVESVGFRGSLKQVARLLGKPDSVGELIHNSLYGAYDIADQALRYYNIIGVPGIDSVHDYICSFDISHLWSYKHILRVKEQGRSLTGDELSNHGEESDSMADNIFNNTGSDFDFESTQLKAFSAFEHATTNSYEQPQEFHESNYTAPHPSEVYHGTPQHTAYAPQSQPDTNIPHPHSKAYEYLMWAAEKNRNYATYLMPGANQDIMLDYLSRFPENEYPQRAYECHNQLISRGYRSEQPYSATQSHTPAQPADANPPTQFRSVANILTPNQPSITRPLQRPLLQRIIQGSPLKIFTAKGFIDTFAPDSRNSSTYRCADYKLKSEAMLKTIISCFGGMDKIVTIDITATEVKFNGTTFGCTYEEAGVSTGMAIVPYDFDFRWVKKFPYLGRISIADPLYYGKMRRMLRFNNEFEFFTFYPYLDVLQVGNATYNRKTFLDAKVNEGRSVAPQINVGNSLGLLLRNTFRVLGTAFDSIRY